MASKKRLSVNLSESEYQELAVLAQQNNVSMAWLGRKAIIQLLEQNKTQEHQLPLLRTVVSSRTGQ